jgi:hypothetical protein
MNIETVREQDAYDLGFAAAQDFWVPKFQNDLVEAILSDAVIGVTWDVEHVQYLIELIEGFDYGQTR